MSENLRTDYTNQLESVKERLDKFFYIVVREDAMRIIAEMESILDDETKWTALSDEQYELLRILENVPEYMDKYYIEKSDGTRAPRKLIKSFKYEGENKKHIDKAIKVYKKYAKKIKSITEVNRDIDVLFLEKLNAVLSEYKSSTDYMTRLVRRLVRYNVEVDSIFKETDTTRVLILKQFIKQFGYNCVDELKCPELKEVVEERYDDKFEKIDDTIFELIDDIEGTEQSDNEGQIYDKNYIKSITKLQDTIKIKAPLIYITKDICKQLCEVINCDVLSDKVLGGEAVLLSDCFTKPYFKIEMKDFVNYRNIEELSKLDELNKRLQDRYQKGYFLHTDFLHSDRLYTLMAKYASEILIKKGGKEEKVLREIYKDAIMSEEESIEKEVVLSNIFDAEKIEYLEINEENYKIVESLEKALFKLKTHIGDSDLSKKREAVKKNYPYAVGCEVEKRTKKLMGKPIAFDDYTLLFRLIVVISEYSEIIPFTKEKRDLLLKALPEIKFLEPAEPKFLSDYISEDAKAKVKQLMEDENIEKNVARRTFLTFVEEFITDKSEYATKLRERIEKRYNNSSKVGGTDFNINKNALFSLEGAKAYEYKLLKIADNLANAVFSSQKKTKEYLYVFAIAFDIRKVEKGHPKRITDIEKNLFWDYYSDNIVNNLPKVVGMGDGSDVHVDGYGINYKNFAEVIFLWSLEQKNMASSEERLKTAYRIIEYCKTRGKTAKEFFVDLSKPKTVDIKTEIYKNEFFSKIKGLSENELKEYILTNYPCKSNDSGIMQISAEQRTAAEIIAERARVVGKLIDKVEKNLFISQDDNDLESYFEEDSILADFFNEYNYLTQYRCKNCEKNSGKAFPNCTKYFDNCKSRNEKGEVQYISNCRDYYDEYITKNRKKEGGAEGYMLEKVQEIEKQFQPCRLHFEKSFSRVNDLCSEEQQNLKLLLDRIKIRLEMKYEKKDKKLHFEKISRSTIVALSFYEIVLINWLKRISDKHTIYGDFEKFYDVFCKGATFVICNGTKNSIVEYTGVNTLLEKAGYQEINPKNIFDIYIIYIAYRDNFFQIYSTQADAVVDFYKNAYEKFKRIEKSRSEIIIDKDNISKDR